MTDTFAVTTARPGQVLRVGAILAVASLPAVVFADAIPRAAALWSLAEGTRPYWVVSEALLLYGLVPLVVLSTIVLFLAPGLLLAIALGRGTSVPVWGLSAIPGSLLSTLLVLEVARRTLPATADALPIGLLMLASMGCCIGLAAIMANRRRLPWPMAGVGDAWPIAAAAVAVVALYLALSPKFLWENFNGDGAHAFEASRLLLHQGWPFFPTSAGPVAGFPGTTSMLFAFPNAWFIRLFGPIEAAVRLPWLVYLPLVVLGIQALAEEGGRRLERRTQLALWAGLLPFVFAMAFSASYSAYHADIALPGVQDTLLVVTLLGYCHAMVRREWLWAGVFALLSYLGLPNGFLLMGFWLLAELAVMRPLPWRVIAGGLSLLVGCILAAGAFGAMLAWTGQTPPGGEYGFSRTIVEVLRLDLTHWRRAVYLIVGGAGLPVAALFLWRRQDQTARRVTLLVLCYFAFFA
ncbi:MAG: hypothetical protein KA020_18685, partial [Planctomycetes bacterium]|nr:hypothetical protein [Planctomycetota bacterium]